MEGNDIVYKLNVFGIKHAYWAVFLVNNILSQMNLSQMNLSQIESITIWQMFEIAATNDWADFATKLLAATNKCVGEFMCEWKKNAKKNTQNFKIKQPRCTLVEIPGWFSSQETKRIAIKSVNDLEQNLQDLYTNKSQFNEWFVHAQSNQFSLNFKRQLAKKYYLYQTGHFAYLFIFCIPFPIKLTKESHPFLLKSIPGMIAGDVCLLFLSKSYVNNINYYLLFLIKIITNS